MKIRSGFVSNSSSSSFILGISKIDNITTFMDYILEKGISNNITIIKKSGMQKSVWGAGLDERGFFVNDGFQSDVSIDTNNLDQDDSVAYVNITNNEGDDIFYDGWECNYDIGIDFFDKQQQDIYNMFYDKQSGLDVKTSDAHYGAGRNG